jgi:hypothetical protein
MLLALRSLWELQTSAPGRVIGGSKRKPKLPKGGFVYPHTTWSLEDPPGFNHPFTDSSAIALAKAEERDLEELFALLSAEL